MKKYYGLLFFLLHFLTAHSQELTQNIRGTILDKETQRSIPGAASFLLVNINPSINPPSIIHH